MTAADANVDDDVVAIELLTNDDVRARLREYREHREHSPLTTPTKVDEDEDEDEDNEGDDDATHVVCLCRPRVTLCGRYTAEPVESDTWYLDDPAICRECARVVDDPCPNCGCRWDEGCRRCATRRERLGSALRRLWPWR